MRALRRCARHLCWWAVPTGDFRPTDGLAGKSLPARHPEPRRKGAYRQSSRVEEVRASCGKRGLVAIGPLRHPRLRWRCRMFWAACQVNWDLNRAKGFARVLCSRHHYQLVQEHPANAEAHSERPLCIDDDLELTSRIGPGFRDLFQPTHHLEWALTPLHFTNNDLDVLHRKTD